MSTKEPKYRPVLTMPQIRFVMLAIEKYPAKDTFQEELLSYLELFVAKQKAGFLRSSYSVAPRQSIEDKLGLGADSKEEKMLAAFSKHEQLGAFICTKQELALVAEYRYLNDLMSPEEETEYEATQ